MTANDFLFHIVFPLVLAILYALLGVAWWAVRSKVSAIESRIVVVESKTLATEGTLATVSLSLTTLTARVGSLEVQVEKLVDAMVSRDFCMMQHKALVQHFDDVVKPFGERIRDIDAHGSAEMTARMATAEQVQRDIIARIERVEQAIAKGDA